MSLWKIKLLNCPQTDQLKAYVVNSHIKTSQAGNLRRIFYE